MSQYDKQLRLAQYNTHWRREREGSLRARKKQNTKNFKIEKQNSSLMSHPSLCKAEHCHLRISTAKQLLLLPSRLYAVFFFWFNRIEAESHHQGDSEMKLNSLSSTFPFQQKLGREGRALTKRLRFVLITSFNDKNNPF